MSIEPSCIQAVNLLNALDESVATIRHLAQLGPVIDGHEDIFPNLIELLSLVEERASHVDKLLSQLASCIRPRPLPTEPLL
jgi:hypothetical protein